MINYKITVCYKLFFDFKSYYYNAGFYIPVGALLFSICEMVIFIILGMKTMNKQIYENIMDILKLKDIIKNQNEKRKEIIVLIKPKMAKKLIIIQKMNKMKNKILK